jgi:hypothetical protein
MIVDLNWWIERHGCSGWSCCQKRCIKGEESGAGERSGLQLEIYSKTEVTGSPSCKVNKEENSKQNFHKSNKEDQKENKIKLIIITTKIIIIIIIIIIN